MLASHWLVRKVKGSGERPHRFLTVWRHLSKTIFTGRRGFLELELGEHVYEGLGKG